MESVATAIIGKDYRLRFAVLAFAAVFLFVSQASAATETVLYTFTGGVDGANPVDLGLLARDSAGTLYGTTQYGGTCDNGTVFQLSNEGEETVLHSFCLADGAGPFAGIIRDSSSNIYGTTTSGGNIGCGTVFKLVGSTLTTLHNFSCDAGGSEPLGIILDNSGNLYGVAGSGGVNQNGIAFEISNTGQFSVIYTFCSLNGCADGSSPIGWLVLDNAGNLYGTTTNGGDSSCSSLGCGVVFELFKGNSGWEEKVLHTFEGTDGGFPVGIITYPVVSSSSQLVFFGTTSAGGMAGNGTIFEMVRGKAGFNFTTLHNFNGSDGISPVGRLKIIGNRIFGTTDYAGSGGYGTVFEMTRTNEGLTETTLYSFTKTNDGGWPESGVVADTTGNLYGAAKYGGSNACYPDGCGVIFEVTP